MTREEAEALAQDTGAVTNVRLHGRWDNTVFTSNELLEFVALVAAKERERIAAEFDRRAVYPDGTPSGGWYDVDEPAEIIRGLK